MLLIQDGYITGNTAPNVYHAFKPWRDPSGIPRWVLDTEHFTHEIDGVKVRVRTQAEMEALPEYQAWQAEQQMEQDSAQAKMNFQHLPEWLTTWTPAQVETYIDANVTDLPSAKLVLKEFGNAILLIRDFIKIHH